MSRTWVPNNQPGLANPLELQSCFDKFTLRELDSDGPTTPNTLMTVDKWVSEMSWHATVYINCNSNSYPSHPH